MTGKQARDISASVRARLMTVAKFNNEAFDLVLVRFAIERLLYRLSRSPYHEQFVVKGAMMFQVWSKLRHRPTRDLDLLGTGEPTIERMIGVFRDLCTQEPKDDGIVFIADTIAASKIKEDQVYEGIRMRFDAKLGSARIPIQVDIGFGDAIASNFIASKRKQNCDDHRLRDAVFHLGQATTARYLDIPRSTFHGWKKARTKPVVTLVASPIRTLSANASLSMQKHNPFLCNDLGVSCLLG